MFVVAPAYGSNYVVNTWAQCPANRVLVWGLPSSNGLAPLGYGYGYGAAAPVYW